MKMVKQPDPTEETASEEVDSYTAYTEAYCNQYNKGLDKYSTPLKTFNGRDAYKDALEETADLLQYLTQLKMERDWYKAEYERLRDT